ncbi:hypothetical protein L596_003424 [Steinernema carpocapsae]|uniref:Uncharacterized protein n=1 Tax=Steinernema carpocapsae TaxID=34508 RepID=A0A4U8UU33_STECR|nr:hypothetical protein L596_003424 [Steinernema carpocapsae]
MQFLVTKGNFALLLQTRFVLILDMYTLYVILFVTDLPPTVWEKLHRPSAGCRAHEIIAADLINLTISSL